jgi:YD repeat-containing protein
VTYAYDTAQRLVTVGDSQHGEFRYAYDQLGNRTASTVPGQQTMESAFDWAGRMTRHAGQASASDAAGNITAYTAAQGTLSFTYTPAHTLEAMHTDQGRAVAYRWDGDGQLIARHSGATQTMFVPDALSAGAWHPLGAVHADGTREIYVWEEGVPLAVVTHSKAEFFLYDHQSVRLVTDQRGAVVQRYDYTPLGALHNTRGQESAEDTMRPAFAGWFLDPSVSLYLTREGAYDPRLGRLLQQGRQVYATVLHAASPGLDRAGVVLAGGGGLTGPGKSPSP